MQVQALAASLAVKVVCRFVGLIWLCGGAAGFDCEHCFFEHTYDVLCRVNGSFASQPAHAPARRLYALIPFSLRHHFSAIRSRNTATPCEVIRPIADPHTPSAQQVALPTATTAAVARGVATNLFAASNMSHADNDAAPKPNHSLIARPDLFPSLSDV